MGSDWTYRLRLRHLETLLHLAGDARLLARAALVATHGVGDVGQVAHARRRHDQHLAVEFWRWLHFVGAEPGARV